MAVWRHVCDLHAECVPEHFRGGGGVRQPARDIRVRQVLADSDQPAIEFRFHRFQSHGQQLLFGKHRPSRGIIELATGTLFQKTLWLQSLPDTANARRRLVSASRVAPEFPSSIGRF